MSSYDADSFVTGFALTGNATIDALFSPSASERMKWATVVGGTTQISYSFPFADGASALFSYSGEPTSTTHQGFNAAQRSAVQSAFAEWAKVANIQFNLVNEDSSGTVGDIRMAFSSDVGQEYWGYTYTTPYGRGNVHGDIWVSSDYRSESFAPFSYNYVAIEHEIGHALGLDHPFEGNIMPAPYDDARYTIMSYTWNADEFYHVGGTGQDIYLVTGPMVYDIQAVQKIYGANMSTGAGDTVYAFDPSQPFIKAIWDASGNDTIDLSAFTKSCTVTLAAGAYSSLGFNTHAAANNLGIAFQCTIENAIGGSANDVLIGNGVANRLSGGAGTDTLSGGDGDDIFDGGAGSDSLTGGTGTDTATYASATAAISGDLTRGFVDSGADHDSLSSIETLIGSSFNDILLGDAAANRLYGGDGNDRITGGAGADLLYGGGGNDIYYVDNVGDAAIEVAGEGVDTVNSSVSLTLRDNVENLILGGTATLTARGNASANALTGNSGSNMLYGLAGDDTLKGGAGNDTLDGGTGADRFYGGSGNDTYFVDSRSDVVSELAGEGTDTVYATVTLTMRADVERLTLTGSALANGTGNASDNIITGNAAENHLSGGAGNDRLYGGAGTDVLNGDDGNDLLQGEAGRDRFYGGTGSDGFIFADGDYAGLAYSTCDQIHDFDHAEGDRLRLNLTDANRLVTGDQAFTFIGTAAFHHVAGELRYAQVSGNTYVQGDTNGDGVTDMMIRLDGLHALVGSDFVL